jgi:CMP-N,N'-diacetyllegionaminic acid synthase
MRILAIIPARGGSKRIPNKNIRNLFGKPLVVWSIELAKKADDICDVLISTDSENIAKVSLAAGGLVPWLRPSIISGDSAATIDVVLHALDWYEGACGPVDAVLLLQPTSPFRGVESLLHGIELFKNSQGHSVISVSPAQSHPLWCFKIKNGVLHSYIDKTGLRLRSQDLPPAYVLNGAFYFATPKHLRNHKTFFSDDAIPLVLQHQVESIDIDTEFDWKFAEFSLNKKIHDN